MGYQTVLTVNHDAVGEIECDENFKEKFLEIMRSGPTFSEDGLRVCPGVTYVARNHHTEKLTVEFDGRSFKVSRP